MPHDLDPQELEDEQYIKYLNESNEPINMNVPGVSVVCVCVFICA